GVLESEESDNHFPSIVLCGICFGSLVVFLPVTFPVVSSGLGFLSGLRHSRPAFTSGNIASIESRSASRDPALHVQPSRRIRPVSSGTTGTSPFHPRFPPVYAKRTSSDFKPAHSTARRAISVTVM